MLTHLLVPFGASLAALLIAGTLLWLLSLRLADTGIVDTFWGPFFLLQAIVFLVLTPNGFIGRRVLVLVLVAIWSVRLATHISGRNAGHGEDRRYTEMRRKVGAGWRVQSLFRVFWLQALLAWIIGGPLLLAMLGGPDGFTPLDAIGAAVWLIGFIFEAVGDFQLAAFTRNETNKGQTMRFGLWRFTRHPNYFGDATQWWGLWLVAVAAGGWWTAYAPAVMTFLLVKVSGVGLLERTIATRRAGYADYMRTTSSFIPWFPKQEAPTDR